MIKEWSVCPYDKKKLLMVDTDIKIEGVFIKCPTCKREIEIKNNPNNPNPSNRNSKPRGQNPEPKRSEVRTLELVSSYI